MEEEISLRELIEILLKGWKLIMKSPSKLTGKEGNLEYCYCYEK
jgi:capsular polysaccharide biosynthesis protein